MQSSSSPYPPSGTVRNIDSTLQINKQVFLFLPINEFFLKNCDIIDAENNGNLISTIIKSVILQKKNYFRILVE